ncbi:hypothetical protein ALC57_04814, partial [Trachymyrmex cornetzi]
LQFSILLVVRLALLHGTLPNFSAQDNPAAFHPCFHVRSNVSRIREIKVLDDNGNKTTLSFDLIQPVFTSRPVLSAVGNI